jgi:hypothetical protein
MKELIEVSLHLYCESFDLENEDIHEEILSFINVITTQADENDILIICRSNCWSDFVCKLTADLSSENDVVMSTAQLVILSLSYFPNLVELNDFLETPIFNKLDSLIDLKNHSIGTTLKITSNFLLSGESFIRKFLKIPTFVDNLMKVIEECKTNPEILDDCLLILLIIIRENDSDIIGEICSEKLELFDIFYHKIEKYQNSKVMMTICDLLKAIYEVGFSMYDSCKTSDNIFIQRVFEKTELAKLLDESQQHSDEKVKKNFDALINFYFDTV